MTKATSRTKEILDSINKQVAEAQKMEVNQRCLDTQGLEKQRFKKKESAIQEQLREAADSQEVQVSGFLKWKRWNDTGWKRNWFVLKDQVLFAFKAVNDEVATHTRPLLGWTLETLSDVSFPIKKDLQQ